MDAAGAQELLMPAMIPEEIYEKSGRREAFGSNMFALKDRYQKNYVLGPTHEELFTICLLYTSLTSEILSTSLSSTFKI